MCAGQHARRRNRKTRQAGAAGRKGRGKTGMGLRGRLKNARKMLKAVRQKLHKALGAK